MACDRHLPRALFRIHPVRHTPDVAIGLIFVLIVILILSGDLSQLATVLLLLLVFSVVNNALAILKLRPSEPQGAFELSLAVPVLGAMVCFVMFVARAGDCRCAAAGNWRALFLDQAAARRQEPSSVRLLYPRGGVRCDDLPPVETACA